MPDSPPRLRAERAGYAPVLAAVAGFTDTVGYVTLDVFTAHMSGNSARLGAYVPESRWFDVGVVLVAVALFVVSIAVASVVIERGVRAGRQSVTRTLLLVEALLLGAFAVGAAVVAGQGVVPHRPALRFVLLVGVLVVAMGIQTSTVQRVSGSSVRTTYVSGMLTRFAEQLALLSLRIPEQDDRPSYLRDTLRLVAGRPGIRRTVLLGSIWLGYAAGAVAGGVLHAHLGQVCMAVPVGVLVLLVTAMSIGRSAT